MELKEGSFLIRVKAYKGDILYLQQWPRKFYRKKVFYKIIEIMPNNKKAKLVGLV
jgi:hypothetical protein